MSTLSQKYNFGWYGECSTDPCTPFLLSDQQAISEVYEVYSDGTTYAAWRSSFVIGGVDYNDPYYGVSFKRAPRAIAEL